MKSLFDFYSLGTTIFGALFPVLFLVSFAVLSIVLYGFLVRDAERVQVQVRRAKRIEGLCTMAVLLGSLQTIISLCNVGFALWFGALQVGTKTFAILIQGFASTGFGIATAIVGRGFLHFFSEKGG